MIYRIVNYDICFIDLNHIVTIKNEEKSSVAVWNYIGKQMN